MGEDHEASVLERIRARFREVVEKAQLLDLPVSVLAKALTPEEAIGTPGRRDFPIVVGRERVVEAEVLRSKGQAFTDSPREYRGRLEGVLDLELTSNQGRAIFVATLNAVLRHLGMVEATVHCRDDDPEKCALEIADLLFEKHGQVRVGLIGFNPAIAEGLVARFGPERVRISDLSADNIGKCRFGVEIWDGRQRTEDLIDASDLVLITGTTIVNGTFDDIWRQIRVRGKDYLLYGVTAAGPSELIGMQRVCPRGRLD